MSSHSSENRCKAAQDKAKDDITVIQQTAKDNVDAIQRETERSILATQKEFELQRTQAKDAADEQIAILRDGVATKLKDLADLEDRLLSEQIRRIEEQKAILTAQLEKLVGPEQAHALMIDANAGIVFNTAQTNSLLGSLDTNVTSALVTANVSLSQLVTLMGQMVANVKPAQHGFEGYLSHSAMFLTHPNEYVSITPGARMPKQMPVMRQQPAAYGSGEKPVNFYYSPQHTVVLPPGTSTELKQILRQFHAETLAKDKEEVLRMLDTPAGRLKIQTAVGSRGGHR